MKIDTSEENPVTHERIAARACELWQKSGSPDGRDLEFWLAAEHELRREREEVAETKSGETAPPRATPGGAESEKRSAGSQVAAKTAKVRSGKARS